MALDIRAPARTAIVRPLLEWPTIVVAAISYGGFLIGVIGYESLGWLLALAILTLAITLHSSCQHEVLHGHPFRSQRLSDMLVFLPIGLFVPYVRFRDLHLAHHFDPNLTDPYDDPESNYLDPAQWQRLPWGLRATLRFNNLLIGRILIGPMIGLSMFYARDLKSAVRGDRAVVRAYLLHLAGLALVLPFVAGFAPLWFFALACYAAMAVLKIRTFLEHRAHDKVAGRTVIIEDRGVLAFLFLNNNFHAVHHAHPQQPWYLLPDLYAARRGAFLERNRGYRYASYRSVFAQYFLRAKDPVVHPLMPSDARTMAEAAALGDVAGAAGVMLQLHPPIEKKTICRIESIS